jgi:UDP-N-acetylmuramate dehydrogenase
MKIRRHFPLKKFNTLGIGATAEQYVAVDSAQALQEILAANIRPLHILGGGSNVLLTKDLEGLVVNNKIGGIAIEREDEKQAVVAAGGGVVWHDLVHWCLARNLGGIENLSLIPGTVGAAPIQNIGAYGVELKDVFEKLDAVHLETGKPRSFGSAECEFGYRNSVFKQQLKGQYFITKVFLRLSKNPVVNFSYGDLKKMLEGAGIVRPTIRDVSEAVVKIRQSKLPDPAVLGNAGSFFKNPVVPVRQFEELQKRNPEMPCYPLPAGEVKVPAGWLIEKAGWKGHRTGDAGCHEKQALVLVNYGRATGAGIQDLARRIQASVEARFGIRLSPEVNIW